MKLKKKGLLTAMAAVMAFSVMPVNAAADTATMAEKTGIVMEKTGGYDTQTPNPDGGVMEIITYNSTNKTAYAVNGQSGKLAILPIDGNSELKAREFDVKSAVTEEDFAYGDMTSVDVSPDGSRLAAAVQAENYADNGKIVIFKCMADGSVEFEKTVNAGVQPDMVIFADNNTVLSADEGEPREGYGEGTVDPKGSVTVADVESGKSTIVDFTKFDSKREELAENNIVIKKNTMPSVDFEPEYIAVSEGKAYVTLQEANAAAVLDITEKSFDGVYSLGFEDYSKIAVDIDKKDEAYNPQKYADLKGIRMADGIAAFEQNGKTYLVTANEGDSREWGDYLNEAECNFGEGEASPTGKITAENSGLKGKVVFFGADDYDGLEADTDYLFGGRTMTIYEVQKNGIKEVFTSGADFEQVTAEMFPENFNCSNDDISLDDRSGKKGPEPENVTVGVVGGRMYAFAALERIGGVMAYDVTNPENAYFSSYVNSREFSEDIKGDVAPEGMKFVQAEKNVYGENLLLTACEVSGTVAVYTVGEPETAGVRQTAEAQGAKVEWLQKEKQVKITKDSNVIVLTLGSDKAVVNGEAVSLSKAVVMENNRTYIDFSDIAKLF